MTRRFRLGALIALLAISMTAAFAATASATPDKTSTCSNCHEGVGATIATTLLTTGGNTATYNVSAPGADAVAVFNGSTFVTTVSGSSGMFSVATGSTYTVYAVTGPTELDGLGTSTVSPIAAPADTVAPTTTSNAVASYVSSAAIKLTATDAGSGVAATYYTLDGGTQTAGTAIAVSTVGSHTIEFWSVDVAGNVESVNTASFTITAPPVVSGTTTTTVTIHASHDVKHDKYVSKHGKKHNGDKRQKGDKRRSSSIQLFGKLMPSAKHASVVLYVMNPGSTTWSLVKVIETNDSHKSNAAMWSYRTDVKTKGSYKFQVRYAGNDAYKASVSKIATVKIR